MEDNIFGPQISVRLTPEQHKLINDNYQLITGRTDPPQQKEFFAALLARAISAPAETNPETAAQLSALQSENQQLTEQVQNLQYANIQLEAENRKAKTPENSVSVQFDAADMYFLDAMISAAQKRLTPGTQLTREIYIRAMIRGLYESGSIHASTTFGDGTIRRKRAELLTPPANE